jgi:hypothetical protein
MSTGCGNPSRNSTEKLNINVSWANYGHLRMLAEEINNFAQVIRGGLVVVVKENHDIPRGLRNAAESGEREPLLHLVNHPCHREVAYEVTYVLVFLKWS